MTHDRPNLQNIPIRTEVGRKVRAAFAGPKGVASVDYSQLELHILAQLGLCTCGIDRRDCEYHRD